MKNISFRLSEEDFAAIEAAAAHEFLPVAAFLRKLALEHARKIGVLNRQIPNNPATQNQPPLTAPMRDDVFTREDLLKRIESGEQLRDVAAGAGIQVSELQARLAKARAARADGELAREQGMREFMQANPAPDDGKEYKPSSTRSIAGIGYEYSWVEQKPAAPKTPAPVAQSSYVGDLTPEQTKALAEETTEKGKRLLIAQEGVPVRVSPVVVDPATAAKLDALFDLTSDG